jgi:hypothetical protein
MAFPDAELNVLQLAKTNALPRFMQDDSVVRRTHVRELIKRDLLNCEDMQTCDGDCSIIGAFITLAGESRLDELLELKRSKTWMARLKRCGAAAAIYVSGIITPVIIEWLLILLGLKQRP